MKEGSRISQYQQKQQTKRLGNKHSLYTTMLVMFMEISQAYKFCQGTGNHKK